MKTITTVLFLCAPLFLVMFNHCARSVDTGEDFAMALNGRPYKVKLAPPVARMQENDVGYSSSFDYTIMFPIAGETLNPLKVRGFELAFDPKTVTGGEVMEALAGDQNSPFRLSYLPLVGHRFNEGILLEYSSRYKTGSLKVRFDILEPEINGRVKGTILEATLYGFYQRAEDMTTLEPKRPKKLEIYNFKFDTTFSEFRFY